MPYVTMDLPVCNRCRHVWLPDLEEGELAARLINFSYVPGKRKVPKYCAKCKDPNWNVRRKHKKHKRAQVRRKTPQERQAEVKAMTGAEIFDTVMKTVKPKP